MDRRRCGRSDESRRGGREHRACKREEQLTASSPNVARTLMLGARNVGSEGCESSRSSVFGGVFDRFPRLKLILAGVDVSWIPHFLYRTDRWAKKTAQGSHLQRLPSDYMRENVWATFLDEGATIPFTAELYGPDRLLWATDFPHFNSAYPKSAESAAMSFEGLSADVQQKIAARQRFGRLRPRLNGHAQPPRRSLS